jgi:hypothetical protein
MQFAAHEFFILPGFDSHVAQHAAPETGTQHGEQREFPIIQPDDSRWNADEVPDNRQQA